MKTVDIIALVLVLVGALNWGLWGAFEFDLVAAIFGGDETTLAKIVYILVGVAAIYLIAVMGTLPRRWSPRVEHSPETGPRTV